MSRVPVLHRRTHEERRASGITIKRHQIAADPDRDLNPGAPLGPEDEPDEPTRGPGLRLFPFRNRASSDRAPWVSRRDLSALEGEPSLLDVALRNPSLADDVGPQG